MDQYEMVRTAHRVYKKSIRQIARETGHTRRTVRKVLGQPGCVARSTRTLFMAGMVQIV